MSGSSDAEWPQERIRLTLPNDLTHIDIARQTVRSAARPYGYSSADLDNWETVVEEAMTNVVHCAYEPGEKASFDIDFLQGAGGLTVRVRDRGRPFDPRKVQPVALGEDHDPARPRGLGWHLMQRLMDVVTLESLGRDGKQLILYRAAPHAIGPLPPPPARPRVVTAEVAAEVSYRMATADDAGDIMQLFYACYRYSYFNEHVYSTDSLARMIETGQIESFVAELPGGPIVGHVALIHYPDRPNAVEYGMAATDPAFRGRGFLDRLAAMMAAHAARSPKTVAFGGAVTVHPASQKAALRTGIRECGLMLGAVPAETFAQLQTKAQARGTILFMAGPLTGRQRQAVVLPAGHEDFIASLYQRCEIPFDRAEAGAPTQQVTDMTVSVRPMLGTVRTVVQLIGGDFTDRLRALMHGARLSRAEVGQLFLPLGDPALPEAVKALEAHGWFVTGILPEGGPAGDVLLMHWLNGWAMDYDAVEMARDEGRQLLGQVRDRDPEFR